MSSPAMCEQIAEGSLLKPEFDLIIKLKAVRFASHLHDVRLTNAAMEDALDLALTPRARRKAKERKTPQRTAILESRRRIDAVAMCLESRELEALYMCQDTVESMHVLSDGSPVTGTELQGMILQIIKRNSRHTVNIILPGVAHGCCRLIDKALALMWAIFLVTGDMNVMAWVFSLIRSVTTDMGVELGLGGVSNLLPIFEKWMRGARVHTLVNEVVPQSRLMPRALTIPGWSHLFANIMKSAAFSVCFWPRMLIWGPPLM